MKAQAKEEAERLFALFYYVFFVSDTDYSEECIISILSINCAKTHVNELILLSGFDLVRIKYLKKVLNELGKL